MKEFIEKLIGRLEEEAELYRRKEKIHQSNPCYQRGVYGFESLGFEKSVKIVNQLAEEYIKCSIDTSSGWIPTSERLPEKNAIVLTCDKDGWISVKVNMPYAGVKNDFESGYYTAWMPLPPAYVPEE